jgi:hypothetical protein
MFQSEASNAHRFELNGQFIALSSLMVKRTRYFILFFFFLSFANLSYALNPAGIWLHHLETAVNPILHSDYPHKYPEIIMLPHVEIPLDFLEQNFSTQFDPRIYSSLIFEKEGKKMVRWILAPQPGDIAIGEKTSIFNLELLNFLKRHSMDTTLHYYFKGYPTASSTYLAEDPSTGTAFFIKTSNSYAPAGAYSAKKRDLVEANDARIINDYLSGISAEQPFQYFTFFPETATFGVKEMNMSLIVRDALQINEKTPEFSYIPAFSALDPVLGKELAEKNGYENPKEFWSKAFPEILGRAVAELFLRTGLKMDSPHSQNYLFEVDQNMKLTGRIVFRDLADFRVAKDYYEIYKKRFHLDRLQQERRVSNPPPHAPHTLEVAAFQTTYGGTAPLFNNHPWLGTQKETVTEWDPVFRKAVFDEFKKALKIDEIERHTSMVRDPEKIALPWGKDSPTFSGLQAEIHLPSNDPVWKAYIQSLAQRSKVLRCEYLFD